MYFSFLKRILQGGQVSASRPRPGRIHSSNATAAVMTLLAVLQISHCLGPGARSLAVLTRPDKIRHRKVTEIQITVSVVLSDWVNVFHHCLYETWRYNHAPPIIEEDVVVTFALVWPSNLTHRMQGPCDVGNVPSAPYLAVHTLNVSQAPPRFFDYLAAGSGEMLA